jgi:pimeloyl-ACP methyl ester carboxylesterase
MKQLLFILAGLLSLMGCLLAQSAGVSAVSPGTVPNVASLGGVEDTYLGFKRHLFQIDGKSCWLVEPAKPIPGNHWVWCPIFPDAFPERTATPQLLSAGYYYAFMDVGDTFGAPSALDHMDAFYRAMIAIGLNPKVALKGISRGGCYSYNWAARNPGKVSVIYGDAPVCNFSSWPANDPAEWKALLAVYGYKTDEEGRNCPTQPIKELEPLAKAHIPLISVVGDADTVVPYAENTALVEQAYKKLGGEITVIHKPGCNHHPHGLDDPAPVLKFIEKYDH